MSGSASAASSAADTSKRKLDEDAADDAADDDANNKRQNASALIFCSSGVYGDDLEALEKSAKVLGATYVTEYSDSVTHLVMDKLSWTPKVLFALANLVPVVNTKWVHRAAEDATAPLPNVKAYEFWPKATPSTDGVAVVQSSRKHLFRGRKFIGLPGAPPDTLTLCAKMGAETQPWPEAGVAPAEHEAYFAERVAAGFGFVLPGDEKWPTSPEAKAALAAGAETISPLLVRTSLIMAKLTSTRFLQASAAALVNSGET